MFSEVKLEFSGLYCFFFCVIYFRFKLKNGFNNRISICLEEGGEKDEDCIVGSREEIF